MLRHAAVLLPFSALVACSTAPEAAVDSSTQPLVSPTSAFLIPLEDDVRVACRGAWTTRYCNGADALAAGEACVAGMSARPACAGTAAGCFQLQTTHETCTASAPAYPDAASCTSPRTLNCAFYSSCIERQTDCGEGGYALGYGEKYCTRYLLDTHFSPAGMAWRTNVMHCLQESLVPLASESPPSSCDTILNDAFDSHPRCYTEGPSICFLPPSDAFEVVHDIDGKDLLSLRSVKQMATVAGTCVFQLAGALFGVREARTALPVELREDQALRVHLEMWKQIEAEARASAE